MDELITIVSTSLFQSGLAALVIPFIVEELKTFIGTRWAPVTAFTLGILFGIAEFYLNDGGLLNNIILGIMVGGTSTGLYSLNRTTIQGITSKK